MQSIDYGRVSAIAADWRTNPYYHRAEKDDWLQPFWADGTPFRQCFAQLDLTNVVDLACGHGRHTAQMLSGRYGRRPAGITLLDVNPENIEACQARFANEAGVQAARNNGTTLKPVKRDSVTAIFCYDAMVHFEYDCVFSYIKDTMRVLTAGGMALYHHSNYAAPGTQYQQNPHYRNFMTKDFFAHVAMRTGLEVVRQDLLDWGDGEHMVRQIDCLTLLRKSTIAPRSKLRSALGRLAGSRRA